MLTNRQEGAEPKRLEVAACAWEQGACLNPRHAMLRQALGLEQSSVPLWRAAVMYDFVLDDWVPLPRGDIWLRPGEGLVLKKAEVERVRNLHTYVQKTLPACLQGDGGRVAAWRIGGGQAKPKPRLASGWTDGSLMEESGGMNDEGRDSDCEIVS